jgi:hypothetical protein
MLKLTTSLAGVVLMFVPVTVIEVPCVATVGVKEVIVGAPLLAVTTKFPELVAVPAGEVT